jgi:signal transduction histidine kinase
MSTQDPKAEDERYARARAAIHDLNNLLNIALANVQLLERAVTDDAATARLQKAESALNRAAQAVAVLSDLLRKP